MEPTSFYWAGLVLYAVNQYFAHKLLPCSDWQLPSWFSETGRMTIQIISWWISTSVMRPSWDSKVRSLDMRSDAQAIILWACLNLSLYISRNHQIDHWFGLGGSVWCAVRLETRRSRVQPPPRSSTFFRRDWSWNIFYGHSFPSADSRRAAVRFWRKNVHNTGKPLRGLSLPSKRVGR